MKHGKVRSRSLILSAPQQPAFSISNLKRMLDTQSTWYTPYLVWSIRYKLKEPGRSSSLVEEELVSKEVELSTVALARISTSPVELKNPHPLREWSTILWSGADISTGRSPLLIDALSRNYLRSFFREIISLRRLAGLSMKLSLSTKSLYSSHLLEFFRYSLAQSRQQAMISSILGLIWILRHPQFREERVSIIRSWY